MKILIAHDGSSCSDHALKDLERAALPSDAEALVLVVADVWLPPDGPAPDPALLQAFPAVQKAHAKAHKALEEARALSLKAAESLRKKFPGWRVTAEACADSPAWAIVKKADEWQADLVVVGSHGRSAATRWTLGSVSHQVLLHAKNSVRISRLQADHSEQPAARGKKGSPVKILLGFDGSPDAEDALEEIASRPWPVGSEVRVVTSVDFRMRTALAFHRHSVAQWIQKADRDEWESLNRMNKSAADKLRRVGLTVVSAVREGDPKHVLPKEAEEWNADIIFVGGRGLRFMERILTGSVSTAVAVRAPCSIEVVRPRKHIDVMRSGHLVRTGAKS